MDNQWHDLLLRVMEKGELRSDRTGVGTRALFGVSAEFDMREGFPAVTTKKLAWNQVRGELAAFIHGVETLTEYHKFGCTLWDANATAPGWLYKQKEPGSVGRIYGVQWRGWRSAHLNPPDGVVMRTTDQLKNLVKAIIADPHGRRHLVTAWNPGELDDMCLPPCHTGFQCFASEDRNGDSYRATKGALDLKFSMRSLDLFIGAPFDIASYALLLHLLARETGRWPRRLIMEVGDCHIYNNHHAQVATVLSREPRPLPVLGLPLARTGEGSIFGFLPEDAQLYDYDPYPAVPAPMNL